MSLGQLQSILARLYTDEQFRKQFFQNRSNAVALMGLTNEESRQMAQLSQVQVEFFARSLRNKRLQQSKKMKRIKSKF